MRKSSGAEARDQRQGDVAVRDGAAERPRLGALLVDVDPLVVVGGVREQVHPVLGRPRATSVVPRSSPTASPSSSIVVKTRMRAQPFASVWEGLVWMWPMPDSPERTVSRELVARAPKVLLHDHLDGGLRPQTILELAAEAGHTLPAQDAESLRRWFEESADSGSLERYLETFDHTVAVMQTEAQLRRVARECVLDLADDGVVYAEVRYAPEQHLAAGLSLEQVVEAVRDGFVEGRSSPARTTGRSWCRTGPRHAAPGPQPGDRRADRRLPRPGGRRLRHRGRGGGLPAHPAPRRVRVPPARERPFTITPARRWDAVDLEAIQSCGADRLGHGVRIIDDVQVDGDGTPALGRLASYVRDKRIPLEIARRRTSGPARPTRSRSTRSACSPSCGSGSP